MSGLKTHAHLKYLYDLLIFKQLNNYLFSFEAIVTTNDQGHG